jgi:GeoRSP system radical SAM/SPASM protein
MKNDEQVPSLQAPLTINWAVNNSCNFACRHCYSREDSHEELAWEVLSASLAKAAKAGVFSVNFGGGEPLLRHDLQELAAFASGLGLRVSMNSNGWLIDRHMAAALKQAGFSKVGISIDSHLPEVHDRFRGMVGSHSRAVAALGHRRPPAWHFHLRSLINKISTTCGVGPGGAPAAYFHNFKRLGWGAQDELDLSPEVEGVLPTALVARTR